MTTRHTLVVLRHAKSDWSTGLDDRHRPLADRGRRQAPEAGRWLAEHGPAPDHVVVSPAVRARARGSWSPPSCPGRRRRTSSTRCTTRRPTSCCRCSPTLPESGPHRHCWSATTPVSRSWSSTSWASRAPADLGAGPGRRTRAVVGSSVTGPAGSGRAAARRAVSSRVRRGLLALGTGGVSGTWTRPRASPPSWPMRRARCTAGPSTQETLDKVVSVATELIDGCDLVGISVVRRGGIDTPAASDEAAQARRRAPVRAQGGALLRRAADPRDGVQPRPGRRRALAPVGTARRCGGRGASAS